MAAHLGELSRIASTSKGFAEHLPISVEDESEVESVHSVVAIDESSKAPSFRVKCVVPLFSELAFCHPPPLRPIEIGREIHDLEDHLDRVFHLAREDALRDLRSALNHVRLGRPSKGVSFKGFADCRFSHISANANDGVIYVFHSATFQNLLSRNPKSTEKRLIRGSLVVVSSNSFRDGVTGVVTGSTREERDQGCIPIWFSGVLNTEMLEMPVGKMGNLCETVSILESEVYWEAYSHSLRALQQLRLNDSPALPRILCQKTEELPGSAHTRMSRFQTEVTFDASQAAAFELICKSVAPIVQGPPGTGKSFVGVSAVRAMLRASEYRGNPIVVVCYTNHALDDFLSDLIEKEADHFLVKDGGDVNPNPGTLVRIGQRSRVALIKEFTMRGGPQHPLESFNESLAKLTRAWNTAVGRGSVPAINAHIDEYFSERRQRVRVQLVDCERHLDTAETSFLHRSGPHAKDVNCLLRGLVIAEGLAKLRARVGDAVGSIVNCIGTALKRSTPNSNESKLLERARSLARSPILALARKCEHEWRRVDELESQRSLLLRMSEDVLLTWRDEKGTMGVKRRINADACYFTEEPEVETKGLTLRRSTIEVPEDEENDVFLPNDFSGYDVDPPDCISQCVSRQSTTRVLDGLSSQERYAFYGHCRRLQFELSLPTIRHCVRLLEQTTSRKVANHTLLGHLQQSQVIGATTTGLARMLPLLQQLNIQCVILEEAAEIPEHHALAAILPGCPKFIQIGDHQQLRPKLQVHALRHYNLNISLMERMLSHNNQCRTLSIQRRMRTEICNFVRPFYAKRLTATGSGIVDHPSIINYPECPSEYGLDMSQGWALWLDHAFLEEAGRNGSYQNRAEAEMAVALAWYFSRQRPEATITVLVPYSAQCLLADSIVRARYRSLLDSDCAKVRIATVDDFQGEESDVIILSLTRSARIGFLGEDNRVCVALSRARHLQVVLGNFSSFERSGSELWSSLIARAKQTPGWLSASLSLYCRRHNSSREVCVSADPYPLGGAASIGGGCFARCRKLMGCGHVCEAQCHADVPCESSGVCRQPCERRERRCGHPCTKACGEDCGECMESSEVTCACGARVSLPCCDVSPTVGGFIPECSGTDTKMLSCGHVVSGPCATINADGVFAQPLFCTNSCSSVLPCGHICPMKCSDCFRDKRYFHPRCASACGKILPCGHDCTVHQCGSGVCPPCDRCGSATIAMVGGSDSLRAMREWQRQASEVASELFSAMVSEVSSSAASQFFIPEMHATLQKLTAGGCPEVESAHSCARIFSLYVLFVLSRRVRRVGSARMQMMQVIRDVSLIDATHDHGFDVRSAEGSVSISRLHVSLVIESLFRGLQRVFAKLGIVAEHEGLHPIDQIASQLRQLTADVDCFSRMAPALELLMLPPDTL